MLGYVITMTKMWWEVSKHPQQASLLTFALAAERAPQELANIFLWKPNMIASVLSHYLEHEDPSV